MLNVKLGKKIFIGSHFTLQYTSIGSNSYCNSNTHIKNSIIGKYTTIGSNVCIHIRIHPINLVTTHPAFYSNDKAFEIFADKMYFDEFKKSEMMSGLEVKVPS